MESSYNKEAADFWARALRDLKTANKMLSDDPDAAASRAYYAAFYAVSALFSLEKKTFSKHSALEVAVHRDLVKAGKWPVELGAYYSLLLQMRGTGDYGGGVHVSEEEASEACKAAHCILKAVHNTSSDVFEIPSELNSLNSS